MISLGKAMIVFRLWMIVGDRIMLVTFILIALMGVRTHGIAAQVFHSGDGRRKIQEYRLWPAYVNHARH